MENYKFILLIALSALFGIYAPINLGVFASNDLPSYRDNYQRIASNQYNPCHNDFNRGRAKMIGRYSYKDATTGGLTELDQFD